MRIFFSAGEASGDAYAAEILKLIQPQSFGFLRKKLAVFRHNAGENVSDRSLLHLMQNEQGLDSLDIVELVAAYEEDTQTRVPDEVMAEPNNKEKILTYVSEKIIESSEASDVSIQAIGGLRLRQAGATMIADCTNWGALGIFEALRVYPRVAAGFYRAKAEIKRGRPGLFIPIDYGYMNIRLARHAKNHGWKVLYFIPPGSWRKDKQGADLPQIADVIVTPFSWSEEILKKMGANAHYFGHPLKEMVSLIPDDSIRAGIAVLPGSRKHEIENNIPAIAEALKQMEGPIHIGVAPTADKKVLLETWQKWSEHIPILHDRSAEAFKASRSAVVCSGTATLEAALCDCPCVVVYRGTKLMEIEYRIRKPRFEYISLPNILLGRPLLKELIQWDATPQNIKQELAELHQDGSRRAEMRSAFAEISASLGASDCLHRTAELAKTLAIP